MVNSYLAKVGNRMVRLATRIVNSVVIPLYFVQSCQILWQHFISSLVFLGIDVFLVSSTSLCDYGSAHQLVRGIVKDLITREFFV